VALWLDNDPGTQGYWLERATEIAAEYSTDKDEGTYSDADIELGDEIKAECEEQLDGARGLSGMFQDLLSATLSEVDWREIAASIMSGVETEERAE